MFIVVVVVVGVERVCAEPIGEQAPVVLFDVCGCVHRLLRDDDVQRALWHDSVAPNAKRHTNDDLCLARNCGCSMERLLYKAVLPMPCCRLGLQDRCRTLCCCSAALLARRTVHCGLVRCPSAKPLLLCSAGATS
jgi:hypothetical protein